MAKTKISEYSATSANNTDISNINIAEGCSPANVNNAIRTIMAQLKDQQAGTSGDPFTVGGNLTVTGTSTLTGNVTAPTQTSSDNSTKVATTAFVTTKLSALGTMSTQNATAVAITGGTITGITDLTVADGGTGASSITANSVVLGNGTSALSGNLVAPSTSGNLLTSNGTTWTSAFPTLFVSSNVAAKTTTLTLAAGTWLVQAHYRDYNDALPATSLIIDGVTVDSIPSRGDPSGTDYIPLFGLTTVSGNRTITISVSGGSTSSSRLMAIAYKVA
jgi:hypothetical protein